MTIPRYIDISSYGSIETVIQDNLTGNRIVSWIGDNGPRTEIRTPSGVVIDKSDATVVIDINSGKVNPNIR